MPMKWAQASHRLTRSEALFLIAYRTVFVVTNCFLVLHVAGSCSCDTSLLQYQTIEQYPGEGWVGLINSRKVDRSKMQYDRVPRMRESTLSYACINNSHVHNGPDIAFLQSRWSITDSDRHIFIRKTWLFIRQSIKGKALPHLSIGFSICKYRSPQNQTCKHNHKDKLHRWQAKSLKHWTSTNPARSVHGHDILILI